ncbi:hypothetical protein [Parasitella parasitica]|uniref:RRM domain-containing protein n=1 Tax=Parasitella parasitica TaxID=35722 RepID=A0A0B7NPR4_9FUNG|nr:hypothetical protein [Parasitella parasitica]
MENQDFYNNNSRLKGKQPMTSRADRASSWRAQRDQLSDNPTKKRRNFGDKCLDGSERLNHTHNPSLQSDNRVSLWCGDVQRHHFSIQPSSAFTVFNDSQLNQPFIAQQGGMSVNSVCYQTQIRLVCLPIGINLNANDHPGLPLSPLQQSMNMPTLVNSITPITYTSEHLRSLEMAPQRFPNSQTALNQVHAFNQALNVSNSPSVPSQSFSPWADNANALQHRDSNQQTMFNSSVMMIKHNEFAIKLENTCKPNTPTKQVMPTWSQIAAGDSPAFSHHPSAVSGSTIVSAPKANEARYSVANQDYSAQANAVINKEMDIDMPDTPSAMSTTTMTTPIRESRYISDSLAFLSSGGNYDQNISVDRPYTVLKIKNISWNIGESDVYEALSRHKVFRLPDILMDVKTGKTLNVAYVELETSTFSDIQIDSAIRSIKIPQMQGRHISVCRSSYDELCNDLFPKWKGHFTNGVALSHTDPRDSSVQKSQYYISQKDLQSLLNVCRFFKTYYNRKCAERPFQYLITIIMNMPWKQPHAVTTSQRDIVYECYKLATEALYKHVTRSLHAFDDELLPRMVRAAIICDGFTVRQKKVVLSNARMTCPKDLESYMQEPVLNTSGFTALFR